jgi:hypothetical protein
MVVRLLTDEDEPPGTHWILDPDGKTKEICCILSCLYTMLLRAVYESSVEHKAMRCEQFSTAEVLLFDPGF